MVLAKLNLYWRLLRPKTVLSTVLAALGGAFYLGLPIGYNYIILALVIVGVTLAHFSVNVLNDYLDYRNGLDKITPRTPFSGGTKLLVNGLLKPERALLLALALLTAASIIGLIITLLRGILILILAFTGALIILTYNTLWVRIGLGELMVLVKGILVFLGGMYAVHSSLQPEAVIVGSVYGLVSVLILYANFIPDVEGDKTVGRRTIPSILGGRAWLGYALIICVLVALIVLQVIKEILPCISLITLTPVVVLPWVALKLKNAKELKDLIEALRFNAGACRTADILYTLSIIAKALVA